MSDSKRPGGLTALAVINFVFGGLSVITAMGLAVMLFAAGAMETATGGLTIIADNAAQDALRQGIDAIGGKSMLYVSFALTLLSSVLLILSGVGYLKQKLFLGRMLGNGYALVAVFGSVISMSKTPEEFGGGFNLGVIFGLLYPILTLVLLNTTFKEDLVN